MNIPLPCQIVTNLSNRIQSYETFPVEKLFVKMMNHRTTIFLSQIEAQKA